MDKTTVFVCTSCRYSSQKRTYLGKRGGLHLWQSLMQTNMKNSNIEIKEVSCLSACKRYCAVAFASRGKTTLMFGDLPALASADAIYELANDYSASNDGIIPREQRPDILRKGILARIPPI